MKEKPLCCQFKILNGGFPSQKLLLEIYVFVNISFEICLIKKKNRTEAPSSPPTKQMKETPPPKITNLQSHAFLQTYSAILPTSLTYIIPSPRGCSPWRPDAVISTARCGALTGAQSPLDITMIFTECPFILSPTETVVACLVKIQLLQLNCFRGPL